LGNKAILYKGRKDLMEIFLNFNRQVQFEKNWDAYSENFSAKVIMRQFNDVFIQGKNLNEIQFSPIDRMAIQKYRLQRKWRNLQKKRYL
jgi:hypothetical protein